MNEKKTVEAWLYSADKKRIVDLVLKMGAAAEEALINALFSLFAEDTYLAQSVVQRDEEINAMEREIDQECLRSIAMRQPVREELRFIFAVLKTTTDIERIGDEAVNIAEWALELKKYNRTKTNHYISGMRSIAEAMLRDALTAFKTSDTGLAKEVCLRDDRLDKMYFDAFDVFIELATKDTAGIRTWAGQMAVVRHLERVGDHITNIAERAYFIATGETLEK